MKLTARLRWTLAALASAGVATVLLSLLLPGPESAPSTLEGPSSTPRVHAGAGELLAQASIPEAPSDELDAELQLSPQQLAYRQRMADRELAADNRLRLIEGNIADLELAAEEAEAQGYPQRAELMRRRIEGLERRMAEEGL